MKKLFVFALILGCAFTATAQKKFGVRLGVGSTDFNPRDLVVTNQNGVEQLKIGVDNATYGFHLGLFGQFRKKKFFIQPEILLSSTRIDYSVDDFENNLGETIKSERFNFVDVPINAGFKFGPLRLQAGPVAHIYVNSFSELDDLEGYRENFDVAALGVQYGVGLDIWRMVLDFKWERNFNNYGDHVTINDVAYNFNDAPDRFIVSLGICF
ncbi:MAG: outer membrane beta-barrel protein [Bacteroidota bacterium]